MEYDSTNTGVLFKNDSQNERAPSYKGKINVDGKEYELAAWIRDSKAGTKFMSLKVQEPFKKENKPKPAPQSDLMAGMDDDVPW